MGNADQLKYMSKNWFNIRHIMAIAMLITSFQSVMAMPVSQLESHQATETSAMTMAGQPMQGHDMATMASDSGTSKHASMPCPNDCCDDQDCGDNCNQMTGDCGNCMHISGVLLSYFEINFNFSQNSFYTSAVMLVDLAPLPPTKPPV